MARTLHVYPWVTIEDSTWMFIVNVYENATRVDTQFGNDRDPPIQAGVTATVPLSLLSVAFDLVVEDTDEDQFVDDALFLDDIQPGPQTLTAWEDTQEIAEGIINGLSPGYTARDFQQAWTHGDTQAVRNSIQRALTSGPGGIGRGWDIEAVHQHEGDRTVTENA